MMSQLLARVAAGGTVHLGELADEFGVTVTAVRDALRDLALRGYLRPVGGDCTAKCGGCAFSSSCHGAEQQQRWTLTEKGRRAATGAA